MTKTIFSKKNLDTFFLKLIVLVSAIIFFGASLRRGFIYDEMECLKSSWLVAQGMVPYRDFFQHHHPLFYYILSPFTHIQGEEAFLFFARGISFLFFLITLISTYLLGGVLYDKYLGLLSVVLLMGWNMVAVSGFEIRPDTPQIALATLGSLFFFFYLAHKKQKNLCVSALLYSLSFLFLQKSFILPAFVLIILFFEWRENRIPFFDIITWAIIYALPILSYWGILLFKGEFHFYWICNYLFNAEMSKKLSWAVFLRTFINRVFLGNHMLWFFFLWGLMKIKEQRLIVLMGILGISVIAMKIDGLHYWLMILPYMSIVGAYALQKVIKDKVLVIPLFSLFLLLPNLKILMGNISFGNLKQLKELSYFRSLSDTKDWCFGDDMIANFRMSPDYFWHGDFKGDKQVYQRCSSLTSATCLEILKKRPKVVQKGKLWGQQEVFDFLYEYYAPIKEYPNVYVLRESTL